MSRDTYATESAPLSQWDEAISDIDAELVELARRTARLKMAKRLILRQRAEGVPWPAGGGTTTAARRT